MQRNQTTLAVGLAIFIGSAVAGVVVVRHYAKRPVAGPVAQAEPDRDSQTKTKPPPVVSPEIAPPPLETSSREQSVIPAAPPGPSPRIERPIPRVRNAPQQAPPGGASD